MLLLLALNVLGLALRDSGGSGRRQVDQRRLELGLALRLGLAL